MEYRIEYHEGCCNYANSRPDLIDWLQLLRDEKITDIKKVYRNGTSVSVLETYKKFINK